MVQNTSKDLGPRRYIWKKEVSSSLDWVTVERNRPFLWDCAQFTADDLIMATCRKTIIALLRTPLSVIMGHGLPSRLHADTKAFSSPIITIASLLQSRLSMSVNVLRNVCIKGKGEGRVPGEKEVSRVTPPTFGFV